MSKYPHADFDKKASELLELYCLIEAKAPNYTNTYSTSFLEKFINHFANLVVDKHSAEEREPISHENQTYFDELAKALDEQMDRLASEDEDYRIHQINKRKLN